MRVRIVHGLRLLALPSFWLALLWFAFVSRSDTYFDIYFVSGPVPFYVFSCVRPFVPCFFLLLRVHV